MPSIYKANREREDILGELTPSSHKTFWPLRLVYITFTFALFGQQIKITKLKTKKEKHVESSGRSGNKEKMDKKK